MNPGHRRHHPSRSKGQVLPIFAIMMTFLIFTAALPVDGGLGMVLLRQSQNAVDLAAQATSLALESTCVVDQPPPLKTINDVTAATLAANIGPQAQVGPWQAWFLSIDGTFIDASGKPVAIGTAPPAFGPGAGPAMASVVPTNACGVEVSIAAQRTNLIAGVLGSPTLSTTATGAALLRSYGDISALAPYGKHTIHAKGEGDFTVFGDVYAASYGCGAGPTQPDATYREIESTGNPACWDLLHGVGLIRSCYPGGPGVGCGEDTIDAFDFSSSDTSNINGNIKAIRIFGRIFSGTKWPLDQCFYVAGDARKGTEYASAADESKNPGYKTLDNQLHQNGAGGPGTAECQASGSGSPTTRPPFVDIFFEPAGTSAPMGPHDDVGSTRVPLGTPPFRSHPRDPLPQSVLPDVDTKNPQRYCSAAPSGQYTGWSSGPNGPIGPPGPGGEVHLKPGIYDFPVVIGDPETNYPALDVPNPTYKSRIDPSWPGNTGGTDTNNVVLEDCHESDGHHYPGIYVFKHGVEICPGVTGGQSRSVSGSDVMLYSDAAYGLTPGAPIVPQSTALPGCPGVGRTSEYNPNPYPAPGPTLYENDDQIVDAGYYGSGTYGITIGGRGLCADVAGTASDGCDTPPAPATPPPSRSSVTLTAPFSGPFKNILLYQNRQGPANIGLDVYPGARRPAPLPSPPGCTADPIIDVYCVGPYHDQFAAYQPPYPTNPRKGSPIPGTPGADVAKLTLNGVIYDNSLPALTAPSPSVGKLACTGNRQTIPYGPPFMGGDFGNCDLGAAPKNPAPPTEPSWATPTFGATVQPETLGATNCASGPFLFISPGTPGNLAGDQQWCHRPLTAPQLSKVVCSPGTPNSSAGRLQLGPPTCENTNDAASNNQSAQINIYGGAVVDVFTTGGTVDGRIQGEHHADAVPIPPPPVP